MDLKQTRFTLAKVKHAAFASEETNCFEALVLMDGKPLARASNDGKGGCTNLYPIEGKSTYVDVQAANKWCKDNLPWFHFKGATLETEDVGRDVPGAIARDLEHVVDDLLTDHLLRKDFQRQIKAKVLFTVPGKPGIRYLKGKCPPTADNIAAVRKAHPAGTILNEMDAEAAFKLWYAEGSK